MTGFDFSGTMVRSDGMRWLSGLSIPESIARNSIFGKFVPNTENALIESYVKSLSHNQKKIILATSVRPKKWSAILKHAKVSNAYVKDRWHVGQPWFILFDINLLFIEENDHKYSLSSSGKIIQDHIKVESKRG